MVSMKMAGGHIIPNKVSKPKKTWRFRYAHEADAAALQNLAINTFYETFMEDLGCNYPKEALQAFYDAEHALDKIHAKLADNNITIIVAEEEEVLIGYAELMPCSLPLDFQEEDAREIKRFYVLRSWRGKKVGKGLMKRCMQDILMNDAPVVYLGVWERNELAKAFYTKRGFERVGEHTFQVGSVKDTDYIYRKVIDPNEYPLKSPCVGICVMDTEKDLCTGCYRTAQEITDWKQLDMYEKRAIVDCFPEREITYYGK